MDTKLLFNVSKVVMKRAKILHLACSFYLFIFFLKFIFRQRGREGEKYQCVVCLSCTLHWGIWPTTQACALTGNRTGNILVHRPALNPLRHTSQGKHVYFKLAVRKGNIEKLLRIDISFLPKRFSCQNLVWEESFSTINHLRFRQ